MRREPSNSQEKEQHVSDEVVIGTSGKNDLTKDSTIQPPEVVESLNQRVSRMFSSGTESETNVIPPSSYSGTTPSNIFAKEDSK